MKRLTRKQWMIVILAAALVAAAGIGIWLMTGSDDGDKTGKTSSAEPPKTTEELMERAAETFSNVDSFQLDTDMTLQVEMEGETVEVSSLVTNFFQKDAEVQKMVTSMTMGNQGGYSTTTYIEEDGESYNLYSSEDGGIQWSKETVSESSGLPIGDPSEEVLRFLTDVQDYEKGETKEIGGVMTTGYTCVLAGEDMQRVFEESGILEQLGGEDVGEDTLQQISEELEDVTYSVWIGNDDYLPYRLTMDMGNLIKAISELADIGDEEKELMESLSKVTMSYQISNYNALEEIEVPKEAKEAS